MKKENRNARRRREHDAQKEARRKAKANARLKLVVSPDAVPGGAEGVRAASEDKKREQIARVNSKVAEYDPMVVVKCPHCNAVEGIADKELVAHGFNRASFYMGCPQCKNVISMKPRKKKLGSRVQGRAKQIAADRPYAESVLYGANGRKL